MRQRPARSAASYRKLGFPRLGRRASCPLILFVGGADAVRTFGKVDQETLGGRACARPGRAEAPPSVCHCKRDRQDAYLPVLRPSDN